MVVNGGRDLPQYIKKALCCSGECVHVQPSHPGALEAEAAETPPEVPVQYTHLKLVAAPPTANLLSSPGRESPPNRDQADVQRDVRVPKPNDRSP